MRCPFCAEEINDAAVVCRLCGRDFQLLRPLTDRIAALENEAIDYRERLARIESPDVPAVETQSLMRRWDTVLLAMIISVIGSIGFYWLASNDGYNRYFLFLSVAFPALGGLMIGLKLAQSRVVEIITLGTIVGVIDFAGTILIYHGSLWPLPRDWTDAAAVMLLGQILIFTFAHYFAVFVAKRMNLIPLAEGGSERVATALARISHTVNRSSAKDTEFWKTILASLTPIFTLVGTIITAYFTYLAALAKH